MNGSQKIHHGAFFFVLFFSFVNKEKSFSYLNLLFLRFNRFLFCLWKREGKRSGRLLKAFYSQAFIFSTSFGTICRVFLFFYLFLWLFLSLQLSFIFSCFEGRCQLFQWNLDPITLDWTVFPLKDFEVWKFHANLRESYLKEPSDCGGDGEGNWYHDLPTRSRKATILGSKFLPETNFLKYIGKRLLLLNRIYFLIGRHQGFCLHMDRSWMHKNEPVFEMDFQTLLPPPSFAHRF